MRTPVVLAFFLAITACGSGGGAGPGTGDGGAGGGPAKCEYPVSQPVSSPCCDTWGSDACGAGLFCAAFDGRQQTTCYPERSRADRAECVADLNCQSGSCNQEERACRSMRYTACDREIGCAPDASNHKFVCRETDNECWPVGDGSRDEICGDDKDCNPGLSCRQSLCKEVSCIAGNGSGPCANDLESGECQSCLDEESNFCSLNQCKEESDRLFDCEEDCWTKSSNRDAWDKCVLASCGAQSCAKQKCWLRVCPELAACH